MTSADVMRQVRDELLAEMKRDGFWLDRKLRFDPTPWDINNGYCDDFADRCAELINGSEAVDLMEYDEELAHTALLYRGKFYDAECLGGAVSWQDLPIVKNMGKTRAQVLAHD